VTALLYYFTSVSHALLFWAAFILTRPLGAVVGDFLDKPIANGGLALSRNSASFALVVVIVALILIFPRNRRQERIECRRSKKQLHAAGNRRARVAHLPERRPRDLRGDPDAMLVELVTKARRSA
jgi:hypothetical protein